LKDIVTLHGKQKLEDDGDQVFFQGGINKNHNKAMQENSMGD
jgi:hypothetical protein